MIFTSDSCIWRVVAVDLRGYGDSDKPSGISQYKMDKLIKDVKQIITALGMFFSIVAD